MDFFNSMMSLFKGAEVTELNEESSPSVNAVVEGYANMQAVIRLLDAKAVLINTFQVALLGYVLCLIKWWSEYALISAGKWSAPEWVGGSLYLIVACFIVRYAWLVFSATSGIWFPNHSPCNEATFSSMFPELKPGDEKMAKFAQNTLERDWLSNGRDSYVKQSMTVGRIIWNKIESGQIARNAMAIEVVLVLLLSIFSLLSVMYRSLYTVKFPVDCGLHVESTRYYPFYLCGLVTAIVLIKRACKRCKK